MVKQFRFKGCIDGALLPRFQRKETNASFEPLGYTCRYNSALRRILTCQQAGECSQIVAFYLCKLKT
jgi:hypothetical protein